MDNQPPAPPSQQSATTTDKTPSQTDADSLIQKIETPIQEQKPNQNDAGADNENAMSPPANKPREKAKWTDIAVVILTFGIVIWAGLQWWEMHDAGTQTNKIIAADERLAKAMEDSVGQAQKGLNASIDLSRKEQRAWVGPTGATWIMRPNQESKWTVVVANTGKSPAMHVYVEKTAKSVLKGTPKDFVYGPLDEGAMHSDTLLQPGMPLILNSTKNPTPSQAQIDMIKSGDMVAYIFGKIRYHDIFGTEHRTTFCLQLGRDLQTVASCKEYNSAD